MVGLLVSLPAGRGSHAHGAPGRAGSVRYADTPDAEFRFLARHPDNGVRYCHSVSSQSLSVRLGSCHARGACPSFPTFSLCLEARRRGRLSVREGTLATPPRRAKSGVRRAARPARQVLPPDNAGLAFVTLGVKRCSHRGRNLLEISAFCRVSEESLGKIVFFLLSVWWQRIVMFGI